MRFHRRTETFIAVHVPHTRHQARLREAAHVQVARYGVVEEVFFRNDPEQCLVNARRNDRGAKSVDGAIRRWSLGYQPPANAKAVFKP